MSLKEELIAYAISEYGIVPENPFSTTPDAVVFRHKDNRKWFGLIMTVKRQVLGLQDDSYVDILNIKAEPAMLDTLIHQKGFLPAYHMNKSHWMTILLDGSVDFKNILPLLENSFAQTASKKTRKKEVRFGPKDWLIPANPKYYDVIAAFQKEKVISWKQSSDVRPGDLLYMYVGAPYSSILFKCKAIEVDIPYTGKNETINIQRVMRIELLDQYEPGIFSFEKLKSFGVYAVRGPRNMPNSLKCEIERYANE